MSAARVAFLNDISGLLPYVDDALGITAVGRKIAPRPHSTSNSPKPRLGSQGRAVIKLTMLAEPE